MYIVLSDEARYCRSSLIAQKKFYFEQIIRDSNLISFHSLEKSYKMPKNSFNGIDMIKIEHFIILSINTKYSYS